MGYSVPKGAHAIRILYHSRALNGDDIGLRRGTHPGRHSASGWVAGHCLGARHQRRCANVCTLLDERRGIRRRRIDAHGRGRLLGRSNRLCGLGTPGPHQYDNKVPQANDVVYSIPAAHAAVADLGRKWVAIGHSQGGVAVWGVAELEARLQDPDYAGAISVAGDMSYEAYEAHDAQTFDPVTDLYWPFTAFGIKASYPAFDVARMLTPPVLARYQDVTTKGCWYYAYAALKEIGRQRAVKQDWDRAPEISRYNADSRSANKPIRGPLLILAGDNDKSVAIVNIEAGVKEACDRGLPIEYIHRPGLDHDPLMQKHDPGAARLGARTVERKALGRQLQCERQVSGTISPSTHVTSELIAVLRRLPLYLFEREPSRPGPEEADGQRYDDHGGRDEDEHADTARTIQCRGNDVAGKDRG